ncbi:MAG: MIP family channel protein [Phycisphaerales bacterium]|nr:MIP family channel protein [Phycisphaerales bacterium]MCB9857387.1 MIP family channel protein [Phycisphaerales bacterium]
MAEDSKGIGRIVAAEIIGTFILVFFGTGSVFVAVLTGELHGLMQVAFVWAIAIGLAIYAVGAISGAHLNPAVTLAFVAFRRFPLSRAGAYVVSQLVGAMIASAVLYVLFSNILSAFEADKHITRGEPGSQLSAMVFGEYFPNPAVFGTTADSFQRVTHVQAMLAEGIGTALLVFFIFALTDARNANRPGSVLWAIFIGLAVAIIIAIVAPLTQAGLNPARDLGPRVFAYLAGWKSIAIPGPRGGFFTVYILAPLVGGLAGGLIYDRAIRPGLPHESSVSVGDA